MKIKFEYLALLLAVEFIAYCRRHNVEVSHLQNDSFTYFVKISELDIKRLSMYCQADNRSDILNLIIDALLEV